MFQGFAANSQRVMKKKRGGFGGGRGVIIQASRLHGPEVVSGLGCQAAGKVWGPMRRWRHWKGEERRGCLVEGGGRGVWGFREGWRVCAVSGILIHTVKNLNFYGRRAFPSKKDQFSQKSPSSTRAGGLARARGHRGAPAQQRGGRRADDRSWWCGRDGEHRRRCRSVVLVSIG